MNPFTPGQRWISDADPQLGLGTVLSCDLRTVTVVFLASGETRTYAQHSAPLSRVRFSPGDTLRAHDGWSLKVTVVAETDGLITYQGQRDDGSAGELPEGLLDNFIQLNKPAERLLARQVDANKWFELRYATRSHLDRIGTSELRGLCGGRTSLLPHQLYIAHEVANRYAPRVLLADEVGLGKTIEAGLILHQQLLTERAQRVLIVVPESLLHQWVVEMLRRFNLRFSIFDEERCQAVEESTGQSNPFQAEQLVIATLEFLCRQPQRADQAQLGDWDLLVVDEAHHLAWTPDQASPEYTTVERLSAGTKGVLLLTATPEQLGKAGHFARLRLLDPDRFPDFDRFVAEERGYEPVARVVEQLLGAGPLDQDARATLRSTLAEGDNLTPLQSLDDPSASAQQRQAAREELVEHLLDRHGTGRVLFRNTRSAIAGFPQRHHHAYPLPLPEVYAQFLHHAQETGYTELRPLLCPELLYQQHNGDGPWTGFDPRVPWLVDTLRALRPEKVVVIAASAETALDLAEALRVRSGINAAVFHEGLSIVERDRAAAYFADREYGSPVLICSEIGSEGRNFQFAHHLVLFDLPLNPDLLEQRIGRLDRIGQQHTIHIHVPYLENSAQAVLYRWYHEGLDAFEHTCPAGHPVFTRLRDTLTGALHQIDDGLADLDTLVVTARALHQELNATLHRGRDRLLEYNSCRPQAAQALCRDAIETDHDPHLFPYLERLFDCYGVDLEEHGPHSHIIRPGDQMHSSHFPGLPDDGITFTCHRDTALANEDMQFVTWEHPLTSGAMEMVISSELGNTALVAAKCPGIKAGTLLLECLFVLELPASSALQANRYLPPSSVRTVLDSSGRDLHGQLAHHQINALATQVDQETAAKIAQAYNEELRKLTSASETVAARQATTLLEQARHHGERLLQRELNRLHALRSVNPNVRDDEITFFEGQLSALHQALSAAALRLDAVRVIVAT